MSCDSWFRRLRAACDVRSADCGLECDGIGYCHAVFEDSRRVTRGRQSGKVSATDAAPWASAGNGFGARSDDGGK